MSTEYALISKEEKDTNLFEQINYVVIGRTHDFTPEGRIIASYLPDDTPIMTVDNDSKIKTIKELKEHYEID